MSLVGNNHGQSPNGSPNWAVLAAQGTMGATGGTGASGATGLAGPPGSTGATGAQGPPLQFHGGWSTSTGYQVGDAVSYGGAGYVALLANMGREPDSSPTYWGLLVAAGATGSPGATGATGFQGPMGYPGPAGAQGAAGLQGPQGAAGPIGSQGAAGATGPAGPTGATGAAGLVYQGAFSSSINYGLGAAVTYNGSSYISVAPSNLGQTPAGALAYWQLLAQAGATGSPGAAGAVGPQGLPGVQGATGGVGPAGATGAAGAAGITFRSAWTSAAPYATNDAVTFAGTTYIALASNRNLEPDLYPGTWSVLAQAGGSGAPGATGATGSVASVTVGTVTTLPAGAQATVTNSGTTSAAILNFALPQGATGAAGGGGGSGGSSGNPMVTSVYHPVSFATTYYAVNTSNASASETASVLSYVARHCSASRLDVYSLQSALITVTLRAGTPGSMTGTALSCSASSNSSCFATGSATITAGEFLDLQITGASGTSAGVFTSVECDLLP